MAKPVKKRRRLRFLIYGLLLLIVSSIGALLSLPWVVSTAYFKDILTARASAALGRPVHLKRLVWTWPDRIRVEDLRIPNDPAHSRDPMLSVGSLHLESDWRQWMKRTVPIRLTIQNVHLGIIRLETGDTNWQKLIPPGDRDRPATARPPPQKAVFPLPFDIQGLLNLAPVRILVEDRVQNRQLTLENAAIRAELGSLYSGNMSLSIFAGIEVGGSRLPDLQLSASGKHLLTLQGELDYKNAELSLSASLPGARFSANGRLDTGEMTSRLEADLSELWTVVDPFLPGNLPKTAVEGRLSLRVDATGSPPETLRFNTTLHCSEFRLSGMGLKAPLGPTQLRATHRGTLQPAAKRVEIEEGRLELDENIRLQWSGTAIVQKETVETSLHLAELRADPSRMTEAFKPFVPEGLVLHFEDTPSPELLIRGFRFSGTLPKGKQHVEIEEISLSALSFRSPAGLPVPPAEGKHLVFSVKNAAASLENLMPVAWKLSAAVGLDNLKIGGDNPLEVEAFELSSVRVQGDRVFSPDTEPPGRIELAAVLKLKAFRDTGRLLRELDIRHVGFDSHIHWGPAGPVFNDLRFTGDLTLDSLQISSPRPVAIERVVLSPVRVTADRLEPQKGLPGVSMEAAFRVGGLQMGEEPTLSLQNLTGRRLSFRIDPKTPSPGTVNMSASFRLDGLRISGQPSMECRMLDFPELRLTAGGFDPEKGWVPDTVSASGSAELEMFEFTGAPRFRITGFHLPQLSFRADRIRPSPGSPFGVSAELTLADRLTLKELRIPEVLTLQGLEHRLSAKIALKKDLFARLSLDDFHLRASRLLAEHGMETPVEMSLGLSARVPDLTLRRTAPLLMDAQGIKVGVQMDPFFRLDMETDMEASGFTRLRSAGNLKLDLDTLPPAGKILLKQWVDDIGLGGTLRVGWNLSGRRPDSAAIQKMALHGVESVEQASDFLDTVELTCNLENVALDVPLAGGNRLKIGKLSTRPAIRYLFSKAENAGTLSADLALEQLQLPPGVLQPDPPPTLLLSAHARHFDFSTADLTQEMEILPYGIKATSKIRMENLDKLFKGNTGLFHQVLQRIGAEIQVQVDLAADGRWQQWVKDTEIRGGLTVGADLHLKPTQQLTGRIRVHIPKMDIRRKDTLEVEGLAVNLDLEKRLSLEPVAGDAKTETVFLSDRVMRPEGSGSGRPREAVPDFLRDIQTRTATRHTLFADTFRLLTLPLPLHLSQVVIDFDLDSGLPNIRHLQMNGFGGTLIGSFGVERRTEDFLFHSRLRFSGLNADTLVPGYASSEPSKAAELSGNLSVAVPLSHRPERMLRQLEADVTLSPIGSRFLERLLYALDPYESNDVIVSQRQALRSASPRRVRINIKNGNLSLDGEVDLKGSRMQLPRLSRFNIAQLPTIRETAPLIEALTPLIRMLEIVSARHLSVDETGNLRIGMSHDQ